MGLNFKESKSRDTQENAANSWTLLSNKGITKIALVTHATHMPRASLQFTKAGFEVTEAAVGQLTAGDFTAMSWLPGASNLELSQSVLRELLARLIQKLNLH